VRVGDGGLTALAMAHLSVHGLTTHSRGLTFASCLESVTRN